jgi:microcystin-dependent protein
MAHNFQRPGLPYANEALQNDNRYQIITRANQRPATDIMLDADFNYVIDGLRKLDIDIAGIAVGILPGSDNPDNANFLPTTDGAGNISWIDIADLNIRDNSVAGSKLFAQTITSRELGNAETTADKLAPNSVTTIKVLDFNITANKLAPQSVFTDKIVDLNVTAAKLAVDSVPTDKIVDLNITTAKIADANVTTPKIADANVTLTKLAQEVLDRLVPIGTVVEFAGSAGFPAMWLECNGQAVSRATYATLFANLGTVYGVGDGATTFNLPDKRGRTSVGIGSDNSTGGRITAATSSSITLGGTFGAETQTLDITQIPSHTHTYAYMNDSGSLAYGARLGQNGGTLETGSAGSGLPHPNVQPSIFTRYYIRAL